MITPSIHHKENVLHLAFAGYVQPQQFDILKPILPAVFRCLRPDFTLLKDLSAVEEIDFACCKAIGDLMERIVEAGAGKVIRVMPDPSKDIGLNILAAFHYPSSLPVKVYKELADAMEELAIDYDSVSHTPAERALTQMHRPAGSLMRSRYFLIN